MKQFEIYLSDLREDVQKRYLEFQGVNEPSQLNAEFIPICVLEKNDEDEEQTNMQSNNSLNML